MLFLFIPEKDEQVLIRKGAAIKEKDRNSKTALDLAKENDKSDIVEILQGETDRPVRDAMKRALEYIRKYGNVYRVQGANVTPQDSNTSNCSINQHNMSPKSFMQSSSVSEHNKQSHLNSR